MNKKYSFKNDYSEAAHPQILEALLKTATEQNEGYGLDKYSQEAAELIKQNLNNTSADVHFLSGGTQTNLINISAILKPYESVIAAESGHIAIHEAGAIEATGHKINTISSATGKITAEEIEAVVATHSDEHMVLPRLVFISQATELGTIYSKEELVSVANACKKLGLYLYLDGARLGTALTSKENTLSLAEIAENVDVFYIGGTKNGALFGEATVIMNDKLKHNFRYSIKQKGGLLAKGQALGVQFLELFRTGLYFDLARHANAMAKKLTTGINEQGYEFLTPSPTNQIFPILPNEVIAKLAGIYDFYIWSKVDDTKSAIRLVTSWATEEEFTDEFLKDLRG